MYITKIKIENFRGLNLVIENVEKDTLIIGKNDSGKSNLCFAIRKVLDYKIRRIPLNESDSTNNNKEPILTQITIDVTGMSIHQRSIIGKFTEEFSNKEYLTINLKGEYDETIEGYNENFTFGTIDESKDFGTNKSTPIDKILNLIYINPNYNFEKDAKNFFNYKQKMNKEEGITISSKIKGAVQQLNEEIKQDESITNIVKEINNQGDFNSIFDDISFDMMSNIDVSNLYHSLDIVPLRNDGSKLSGIGDGKNKILSMLLQKMSYDVNKETILLVEEPENHLYPLLQKHYADLTSSLEVNQTIYTTHSPYIIDFKKNKKIIKLVREHSSTYNYATEIKSTVFEKFGYLMNDELAEMFYYNTVLLVEGLSEKYFYNYLYNNDKTFRNYVLKENVGVFNIMGVDYAPIKKILEGLNIKVLIKTDNDIFKVPYKELKRYAGYERTLNCLSDDNIEKLKELLGVEEITKDLFRFPLSKDNIPEIEEKYENINEILESDGIYISSHHNGFEEDLLEFIDEEDIDVDDMAFLKKAKLKNLHSYILENEIPIQITDSNKNSILVRFVTDVKY